MSQWTTPYYGRVVDASVIYIYTRREKVSTMAVAVSLVFAIYIYVTHMKATRGIPYAITMKAMKTTKNKPISITIILRWILVLSTTGRKMWRK